MKIQHTYQSVSVVYDWLRNHHNGELLSMFVEIVLSFIHK